ncbi:MAG: alpha/beta hydrolase [Oligoflexia bacterium]|nr:alpha/beta hydrolase [Oligoflexia bacterium]
MSLDYGKYISVGNNRIYVDQIGSGYPLLAISGFGCDSYNFDFLAPRLASEFRIVMIHNRGMGKSERCEDQYCLEDLAHDAAAVMEELGYKKYGVIGISMGGMIAQKLVNLYPDKVSSLSLLCTTSPGKDFVPIPILTDEQLENFYLSAKEEMIPLAVELTTHPSTSDSLKNNIVNIRLKHHENLDQVLLQRNAVANFLENDEIDYEQINIPTLILSGKDDRFVSPKNSQLLNQKIKNSKLTYFENSDHFFFMEKAPEVSVHLLNFFEQGHIYE